MNFKIIPPDDWGNDWWGWVKSQTSHIFVGYLIVFLICVLFFYKFEEFPVKNYVLATTLVGYTIFKLTLQGWQGVDTIEDIVILVGYGAAGILSAASEIEVGKFSVRLDLYPLLPYLYVISLHFTSRVLWMVVAKYKLIAKT